MIKSINKIKNFGLFKDFKWNSNIPNFSQYNLIYGWNYSGKATLSRMFRCIESKLLHSEYEKHFSKEYENLMSELNVLIKNLGKYKILISSHDEKRL